MFRQPHHNRQGRDMSKDLRSEQGNHKAERTGFFARFVHDRRGSTAIEFAMLAIPFALIVFAILESCISFAGQEVMANATDDIARQLRTGQIRKADVTEATLKDAICSRLEVMVAENCPGLSVDLRTYTTFADAASAGFKIQNGDVVLTQGTKTQTFTVAPGLAETKNMLRVFYKWPVMTDLTANMGNGYTLHFASVTWQNEPFNN